MSSAGELHMKLHASYNKCNSTKSGQQNQTEANKLWNETKDKFGTDKKAFQNKISQIIKTLDEHATRKRSNLMSYFVKAASAKSSGNSASATGSVPVRAGPSSDSSDILQPIDDIPLTNHHSKEAQKRSATQISGVEDRSHEFDNIPKRTYQAPAQSKTEKQLNVLESTLNSLLLSRDSGLVEEDIDKKIKRAREIVEEYKKRLIAQKRNADYQNKYRKKIQEKLFQENPNSKEKVAKPGRPRLEEDQPEMIRAITEIALFGSQADERRRSQMIRTCRTLNNLHSALGEAGFVLSRSATYLRLLPRNSQTLEGKRHVNTVPVKLVRATTNLHKSHPDQHFCTASIRSLESLASLLGPSQVFFLSQDHKARVPIGMTAAHKQFPAIMHMEYRILLPDHDWVIAERHELIPSVYADIRTQDHAMGRPDGVSYSGPTHIAIRSGKHSSSTANTHYGDFNRLLEMEEFAGLAKTEEGKVKPVVIFTVDGGPDENPRYPKVIANAIRHFKDHDVDAVYVVTNAPGRSAYNRVERRMAPLSLSLSGLVLPHGSFGNHLDGNGKTNNPELELENFARAGEILAELWSSIVIDSEVVCAQYCAPMKELDNHNHSEATVNITEDAEWYSKHIQESQYFLQVSKCTDVQCCGVARSKIRDVLPTGFFPPPVPLRCKPSFVAPPPKKLQESDPFMPLFRG